MVARKADDVTLHALRHTEISPVELKVEDTAQEGVQIRGLKTVNN